MVKYTCDRCGENAKPHSEVRVGIDYPKHDLCNKCYGKYYDLEAKVKHNYEKGLEDWLTCRNGKT